MGDLCDFVVDDLWLVSACFERGKKYYNRRRVMDSKNLKFAVVDVVLAGFSWFFSSVYSPFVPNWNLKKVHARLWLNLVA